MAWLQPDLKLLVMLREPASRFYSAYTYYNRRYRIYEKYGPQNPASFGRMAKAEVSLFDDCRRNHSARRCARSLFYPVLLHQSLKLAYLPCLLIKAWPSQAQQLVKGLYALFLHDWIYSFPSSQILVLRLEDYDAWLPAHLKVVMSFLSLSEPS
ncbi:MAG: hypothetical protein SGPRY_006096, partial [Prymnesium sp.]